MKILDIDYGNVEFNKIKISNFNTYAMTSFGIGYMPEDRRLIPNLTVKENILLPLWSIRKNNVEEIIVAPSAVKGQSQPITVYSKSANKSKTDKTSAA